MLNLRDMNAYQAPGQEWQEAALQFVEYCEGKLWTEDGNQALDFLHRLGLKDDVIRDNHLGYNPQDRYDVALQWGISNLDGDRQPSIWLPQGITLPCIIDQQYWYIKIRKYDPSQEDMQVKGGRPALYGADKLGKKEIALIVDGEFDLLIAKQIVGHLVDVVTFGNVYSRPVVDYWKELLLPLKAVLLAFGSDDLGQKHSRFLRDFIPRSYPIPIPVLEPGNTNIVEYVSAGGNLSSWLLYHLDNFGIILPQEDIRSSTGEPDPECHTVLIKLNEVHEAPWKVDISKPCFACGRTNYRAYPDGDGHFCATCHPVYSEDDNQES